MKSGGEEKAEKCRMGFVLGSACAGDCLRCHLLDHRPQELPQQGGSCPRGERRGGGGWEFLVDGPWRDCGAGVRVCCSSLVDLPSHLF